MKNDKDLLCISPVKDYTPPQIPTLEDTRVNLAILKKLPSRWQKNRAVIACVGLVGTVALSGCAYAHLVDERTPHSDGSIAPYYIVHPTEQVVSGSIQQQPEDTQTQLEALEAAFKAADLNLRTHFGGAGHGPIYVVHITEQEALGIIRTQLEAAGLNFDATPPEYIIESGFGSRDIGFDLYDEEKGVAIAHLSWEDNNQRFFSWGGSDLAERLTEEFTEKTGDISVGVFFNPGKELGRGQAWLDQENERWLRRISMRNTNRQKEEAKAALTENITSQVQAFIDLLQAEGIV